MHGDSFLSLPRPPPVIVDATGTMKGPRIRNWVTTIIFRPPLIATCPVYRAAPIDNARSTGNGPITPDKHFLAKISVERFPFTFWALITRPPAIDPVIVLIKRNESVVSPIVHPFSMPSSFIAIPSSSSSRFIDERCAWRPPRHVELVSFVSQFELDDREPPAIVSLAIGSDHLQSTLE